MQSIMSFTHQISLVSDVLFVLSSPYVIGVMCFYMWLCVCQCYAILDHLCGLVVRVLGYRSGGPGSIPGTNRKKVVGLERGPFSLVSTTEELLDGKVARLSRKSRIRPYADHMAPSICKSWQSLRRHAAVARLV
jgi:hypothetical protein